MSSRTRLLGPIALLGGLLAVVALNRPGPSAPAGTAAAAPPARAGRSIAPQGRVADAGKTVVPAGRVPWTEDLDAGFSRAIAEQKLVLLYLHLPVESCPACRLLQERVLTRPEAAGLAERFVTIAAPLRVDRDPRIARLLRLEDVRWAPALLVLSPEGDVVRRDLAPLVPAMTLDGRPVPEAPADLPSLERIEAALDGVEAEDARQREHLERLASAPHPWSVEHVLAYGAALEARGRWEAAADLYRTESSARPEPEPLEALARAQTRLGDLAGAAHTWSTLAAAAPAHERATSWRVEAFLLDPASPDDPVERARRLRELVSEAMARGDVPAARRARLGRAEALARAGRPEEAREELAWVEAHLGAPSWDAAAWSAVALLAAGLGDPDSAVAHLESVLRRWPASPEAETARHGRLDAMRRRVAPPSAPE